MNENQDSKNRQSSKRKFSMEEKRNYYMAWEKSGMGQVAFCRAHGISKTSLYQWSKKFKKKNNDFGFSELVLDKKNAKQADLIQLSICFHNQMLLSITIPAHRLVSFIQELGNATTIIR